MDNADSTHGEIILLVLADSLTLNLSLSHRRANVCCNRVPEFLISPSGKRTETQSTQHTLTNTGFVSYSSQDTAYASMIQQRRVQTSDSPP